MTSNTSSTPGQNWSRAKYDTNYVPVDLRQSTAPLAYSLDPTYAERCAPCLSTEVGWLGKQGVSYDQSKPLVDTESDLFNINRMLSRDPRYKYQPSCNGPDCVGVINGCDKCQPTLTHFPICEHIKNESSRLSNPTSTLRESGVNRFQPICLDPQTPSRWEHPGEVGINYRMIVKDNHVPCIPQPIDQTAALPPGGELPCETLKPMCLPPITAMNSYRYQTEQIPINQYK
uniref:Uncharacterized protein n=1 Tax=viral metagenome TaxID=1070528 RepID=A0A6C0BM64_9ZZZZ